MRWSERQLAMLRELGIRMWVPEPAVLTVPGAAVEARSPDRTDVVEPADRPPAAPPPSDLSASRPSLEERSIAASLAADTASPRTGLAQLGAAELRASAAACTACALCAGRTLSVFGGTRARADWMVVGEPPVEAEDRAGEPFVGKPGVLLDNMLRAIGVARHGELSVPSGRAYATVPVKCRPPGNRPPTADEFAACEAYLARQIELADAKIVLALGSAAALLLRSTEPLGRLRGRVHRYRGLPLVATYAPAYLLRHAADRARAADDKARVWDDLCLAVEALGAART